MTEGTDGVGAMSLLTWLASLDAAAGSGVDHLVAAGIARQDVEAYAIGRRATGSLDPAPTMMKATLGTLGAWWPHMSVRDALGWTLVFADVPRAPEVVRVGVDSFGEGGWLLQAAGLSPTEAHSRVEAGLVDTDALVTLAALRGVPVPVTV